MTVSRPHTPERLGKLDEDGEFPKMLVLAPEIGDLIQKTILADDGAISNPDQSHLVGVERSA